jgi:hypothetical protein
MDEEKQCKCCKEYWWEANIHSQSGLCPNCYDYVADLEAKLSEKERQYETLYKLFSEQHEIIDQYELECFEEVNRLLKEQKDFYVVEKVEYDKIKQGAKDIVDKLKQQLAEKDEELHSAKVGEEFALKCCDEANKLLALQVAGQHQDKISFAVEQIIKTKETLIKFLQDEGFYENEWYDLFDEIDNQIKQLKEGK